MSLLLSFAVALVTVLVFTPGVRNWARRAGLVDHPTRRKVHVHPTPLGGGVVIAAGVLAGVAAGAIVARAYEVQFALGGHFPLAVLGGLALTMAVGLADDRTPIPPAWKLAGQVAAASILILGSGRPNPAALHGLAIPIALVGAVALMNACNFLDNMDGVLSGVVLVCASALVAAAHASGGADPLAAWSVVAASSTAGAAAGFLAFNFPPARIFMGDAGSLTLGFLLAAIALGLSPPQLPIYPGVGLLLILGYPLFDLTFVTVTRIRDGRKVWTPGRDHTSHRLNQLLSSGRTTALAIYGLTAIVAAAGVLVCRWPGRMSLIAALAGGAMLLGLGMRLARVPRGV